jgi:hypothetical protein
MIDPATKFAGSNQLSPTETRPKIGEKTADAIPLIAEHYPRTKLYF